MRFLVLLASALPESAADLTTDAGGNTNLTGSRAIVVPPPTSPTAPLTDVLVSKVAPPAMSISLNNSELPDFRVMVDTAIPEVARHTEDPTTVSSVAAINQDGAGNSQTNPAKAGSFVSIRATGVPLYGAGLDGQMATAAQPECNCLIRAIPRPPDQMLHYR